MLSGCGYCSTPILEMRLAVALYSGLVCGHVGSVRDGLRASGGQVILGVSEALVGSYVSVVWPLASCPAFGPL